MSTYFELFSIAIPTWGAMVMLYYKLGKIEGHLKSLNGVKK